MKRKLLTVLILGLFVGTMNAQHIVKVSGDAIFPDGDEALENWVVQNVILPSDIYKIVGQHPYVAVFDLTIDTDGKVTTITEPNNKTSRDKAIHNCLEEGMVKIPLFLKKSGDSKRIAIHIYGGNDAIYKANDLMGAGWLNHEIGNVCKPTKTITREILESGNAGQYSDIADAKFVVDETGKLTNITVKCKQNPQFAENLQKALSEMPLWIPAKKDGSPISQGQKVNYILRDWNGTITISVEHKGSRVYKY